MRKVGFGVFVFLFSCVGEARSVTHGARVSLPTSQSSPVLSKANRPQHCQAFQKEHAANLNKRWVDVPNYTGLQNVQVGPDLSQAGGGQQDFKLAFEGAQKAYQAYDFLSDGEKWIDPKKKVHFDAIPAPAGYVVHDFWYDGKANYKLTGSRIASRAFAVLFVPKDPNSSLPDILSIEGTKNVTQWKSNLTDGGYSNALGLMFNSSSGRDPKQRGHFIQGATARAASGKRLILGNHSLGGIIADYASGILPAEARRQQLDQGISGVEIPNINVYNFNSGSAIGSKFHGVDIRSRNFLSKLTTKARKIAMGPVVDKLPKGAVDSVYKALEHSEERRREAAHLSRTIQLPAPYNTEILRGTMPKARTVSRQRYEGLDKVPALSSMRFAFNLDPLTALGNPILGNYFPGFNVSITDAERLVNKMKGEYFPSKANLKQAIKSKAEVFNVLPNHLMPKLDELLAEDKLRSGIHQLDVMIRQMEVLFDNPSRQYRPLHRPIGSVLSAKELLRDIEVLKYERSKMATAYYAIYCL